MDATLQIQNTMMDVIPFPNITYTLRENEWFQEYQPKMLHLLRPFSVRPFGFGGAKEPSASPLIVYIGGGAWRASTPWRFVSELCYYARRGYAVATIDYTVSAYDVFPAQIEDVKTAIRFLRKNAERFGIDASHVAVMGDSAGGHLAALAGASGASGAFRTNEYTDMSDEVSAVVDFYGPVDFTAMPQTVLSDGGSIFAQLFGGVPAEMPDKLKAASPITYISEQTPPFFILHGTADSTVDISQSERLYDALTRAGLAADLLRIEGAEHADVSFVQDEILARVLAFLDRYMK